ncbi:hypothetical protein A2856_02430 [Candidatus Uhrbacteria bacterium RIFCSPHIGHO2_01_FULL_63_20]|uniref:Uncharacterized protein n=1 Tax=Candidatus Uhrbacteria bacterium RIFCSPHIGHO2_01_FULL_63_20 TaxID=1802385 RepID=A0A1F7TKN5_9BACT|nr:MAG: hypothetical protein A2856_02430 [Candidatus Uhrbacteria bacterium RIFCSPHIGHO2_01_FULL_63_20]
MTENLIVDREELFQEIVELGRTEGINDQEAYNDLVDETVERHRDWGEMHDDSSTVGLSEALRGRWADYRAALGLDAEQPQL